MAKSYKVRENSHATLIYLTSTINILTWGYVMQSFPLAGKEFVKFLEEKYTPTYGEILDLRLKWMKLEGKQLVRLWQHIAVSERIGADVRAIAILRFQNQAIEDPRVFERLGKQCYEEYRHYRLVKEFLQSEGSDVGRGFDTPFRYYFDFHNELDSLLEFFAAGNFGGERNALNMFRELPQHSKNQKLIELAKFVYPEELTHVAIGRDYLEKHAASVEEQKKAEAAMSEALNLNQKAVIAISEDVGLR